tara:strand:+ start:1909 stop:2097 length:189 start_codon:yes stop_codon:yes gene_type:complete
MAILYLSNYLTGLSTDTKPTNVQDKSIFYQTDNSETYDFNLSTTTWTVRSSGMGLGTALAFI